MKIDISEHAVFGTWLTKETKAAAERALFSSAIRIIQNINTQVIPNVTPHPPVDRGTYRAGFRAEPGQAGTGAVFIVNTIKHALFIERGVRPAQVKPGAALIVALARWVQRKNIAKKGWAGAKNARSIAWAIAKSMQKKGIFRGSSTPSGLQIVERALLDFDVIFKREMDRELKKVK